MVSINELNIQAEKHDLVTILKLAGAFTEATGKKLESVLLASLDARSPRVRFD